MIGANLIIYRWEAELSLLQLWKTRHEEKVKSLDEVTLAEIADRSDNQCYEKLQKFRKKTQSRNKKRIRNNMGKNKIGPLIMENTMEESIM